MSTTDEIAQALYGGPEAKKQARDYGYGRRSDGSFKGPGFLGELQRPAGGFSTEISIGVNINGKETEIPSIVPTLSKKEIDHLLNGAPPTKAIVQKAVEHARDRIKAGKSPFFGEDDEPPPVADEPAAPATDAAP